MGNNKKHKKTIVYNKNNDITGKIEKNDHFIEQQEDTFYKLFELSQKITEVLLEEGITTYEFSIGHLSVSVNINKTK